MFTRQRVNELTDITVDRSPVDHVIVPHNRVDALYQASNTSPKHVHAGAGIPSCVIRS